MWRIYTWLVPSPAASLVPRAAALRREVVALVVELKGTSVQNEFARWAKLQRALDGKKSELTTLSTLASPLSPPAFCLLLVANEVWGGQTER